jgi:hypothetical protein
LTLIFPNFSFSQFRPELLTSLRNLDKILFYIYRLYRALEIKLMMISISRYLKVRPVCIKSKICAYVFECIRVFFYLHRHTPAVHIYHSYFGPGLVV